MVRRRSVLPAYRDVGKVPRYHSRSSFNLGISRRKPKPITCLLMTKFEGTLELSRAINARDEYALPMIIAFNYHHQYHHYLNVDADLAV